MSTQGFQITFLFRTDEAAGQSRSVPLRLEAESVDEAKRLAVTEIVRAHRTVNMAVLTRTEDQLMEVSRWVPNAGWVDA